MKPNARMNEAQTSEGLAFLFMPLKAGTESGRIYPISYPIK